MTNVLGNLLFANWRNKGVALFFAVGIWFLAFQSETRQVKMKFKVKFRPVRSESSAESFAIVGVRASENEDYTFVDGGERTIEVDLVGPRKQIDKLDGEEPPVFVLTVEPGQQSRVLHKDDFAYPRGDVTIEEIQPKTFYFQQERVKERLISELAGKVSVTEYDRSSNKEITEVLKPANGELRIRGPESIIELVSVSLPVEMNYGFGPVERDVEPTVVPANDPVVEHTVQFWDYSRERWVSAAHPPTVAVRVRLEVNEETFSCDGARVVFQLPLTQVACKVTLRDMPPGADVIPVEFRGPKVQIDRLRAKHSQPGGITLSVPTPPRFDRDKSDTYTFSEDSLVLDGFPEVQVLQHESRREERRAFWTYEVKVFAEKEGNDG